MNFIQLSLHSMTDLYLFVSLAHQHFARVKAKLSYNPLGLSFPEFATDTIGLTVCVHGEQNYLAQFLEAPDLSKFVQRNQVAFNLISVHDLTKVRWIAFKRNRALERGSPKQVMNRLGGSPYQHAEARAKFNLDRYFKTSYYNIPIPKKASRSQFSLIIEPEVCSHSNHQIEYAQYRFNAYGLSTSSVPIFLPVQ